MRDKDDDLAIQNTIGEETGMKGKLVADILRGPLPLRGRMPVRRLDPLRL